MDFSEALLDTAAEMNKWACISTEFNNADSGDTNIVGITPIDIETKVYRYTTLSRLQQMIVDRENVLVKPELWNDPFEKLLTNTDYLDVTYQNSNVITSEVTDNIYGQCWTVSNIERDYLWTLRANRDKDEVGVRIETTLRKLFLSLWLSLRKCANNQICANCDDPCRAPIEAYIGRVDYKPKDSVKAYLESMQFSDFLIPSGHGLAYLRFIKPVEFDYEEEVRLLYRHVKDSSQRLYLDAKLARYPIEPLDLINEVVIDPRLSDTEFQKEKYGLNRIGYTNVRHSDLYQMRKVSLQL